MYRIITQEKRTEGIWLKVVLAEANSDTGEARLG